MSKFSTHFGLNTHQASLDFIDIDTDRDTPLFVDPYALSIQEDEWGALCTDHILSYFQEILTCIKNSNHERGRALMNHLGEPNETCLGFSKGTPAGRGMGKKQAGDMYGAISQSQAAQTGALHDLSETTLFVEGIGPDKISDLTTNVIRAPLISYTKDQCELHGIPLTTGVAMPPSWNHSECRWESRYADVPIVGGKPILLVPKHSVRRHIGLDSQEFYTHYMLTTLQTEHLKANTSLVEVLKNNKRRVTKKSLKKKYPLDKDEIFKFVQSHPSVLETYKNAKGAEGCPSIRDLVENFDPKSFAKSLRLELKKIGVGKSHADKYHKFIAGVLTFIFYPLLTIPKLEKSANQGRKRIDILFTNSAKRGFFYRARSNPRFVSNYVVVECKNYKDDIANPEFDQLMGRLKPNIGKLGIMLTRQISDRKHAIQRCRDAASNDQGVLIPLEDKDIDQFLAYIENATETQIDRKLEDILQEILV